jgi:peptidyl-prolyl cis-trans isomerase SurA
MTRTIGRLITLVLVLILPLFLAVATVAEVVDRIVAVVDDEIITMSELEQKCKAFMMQAGVAAKSKDAQTLKRQVLDALIDQKLARAEAKKRGIEPEPKEVDKALEQFKKRNKLADDAALNQALAQANLTMAELRQQIADQLAQERLFQTTVGAKATASDAEVRRFYDEHVKEGGNQVHLRALRILYPPGATQAQKDELQKKAEAILKEALQGTPFKDLAEKFAVPAMDMGFLPQSDLDPQLVEYLNRLKVGGIFPVQTPEGFQLIQLVERRAGLPPSFEEAAPEIRRTLMQKDQERRFSDWLKTLREHAAIKIIL